MDKDKKKEVFEQLKIELRSILLSSKEGVSERLILSDYEMLSCQRLPYKNLGYANVAALLADMPDVAKEIRLASGEVIYKAVSNESTAHIQRLVGNQKSAKKKSGRGRGVSRGRGGTFRGGVARGARGGRGGSFRGSLTPRFTASDRGRGSSFVPRGARARGGPAFKSNSSFGSSKENVNPRQFGGPRGVNRSSHLSFAGDVRGNFNSNATLNSSSNSSNFSGDVRNRGGNLPITKHDGKPNKDVWEDSEQDSSNVGYMSSPVRENSQENRQELSPMINLKIGLGSDGQRTIVAGSPIKTPLKHIESSEIDAVTPGGQIDIRRWLEEKKQAKETAKTDKVQPSSPTGAPERKKVGPVKSNENREEFKRNLPPRFMKQHKPHQGAQKHHNTEESHEFSNRENGALQEQKALHTILSNNWVPPENGAQYLQAYHKYFADRGEPAPPIEVKLGRAEKEKGFYGQLYHQIWYFPLEIQKTEELAKENAARSFCITNNIPLAPQHSEGGADYVRFASSEPSDQPCPQPAWMASLTQQLKASIDLAPTTTTSQQTPASPMPSPSQSAANPPRVDTGPPLHNNEVTQQPSSLHEDPIILKKLEKIYKMLKPAGMFVKSLADFYLKTYNESLDVDALPYLQTMTGFFTLEETIPGRIIVCPVPGASFNLETNNNNFSPTSNTAVPQATPSPSLSPTCSPQATNTQEIQDTGGDARLKQLEKGSELDVIFSYAYSVSEVYFQLALSEDVIYEILEELTHMCSAPAPSNWTLPEVGELVAASYEGGWYRAQINEINPPQVYVYFIDYGNRESIDVSELRPLPQKETSQLTPPLALRCALTSSQASFFTSNTHSRLEELSILHPVLRAVVLDNADACIVELQQKDGAPLDLSAMFKSKEEVTQETSQSLSTTDPAMLVLPEDDTFAVYICQIRTECSVLLRVVDTNYSDALDDLEQVISDNFYSWPIPQQVKERQMYAAMVLATADEAEDEGLVDQNKYHRVRVLRHNKDGSFTCYLPDHSDEETIQRNQLREIDPQLNRSLPYQAVLATLHGLDLVEEALKPTAMEILLKLVNFTMPVYAVRRGNSQALEIDIVVTENDEEMNVNEAVITALAEVREGLSQGKELRDILHTMFGSSSGSHADSQSVTSPSAVTEDDATEDLQASLGRLSVTVEDNEAQSRLNRVQDYVDDLPSISSPGTATKLYTWSGTNQVSPSTSQPPRLPQLPTYWPYTFFKSVSLYITWVESPSHFVAIPLEQQGALEKVEAAMDNYFSTTPQVAETLSEAGLYAVRSEGKYRRALYMGLVGGMAKMFFPDHHSYDTVDLEEVMSLPEQFYSLPFLAYKMRLRAMKPKHTSDWPDETVTWFKENLSHKALYAVIFSQDDLPSASKHTTGGATSNSSSIVPGTLAVRLIDTSGSDDIIVDELMAQLGMAVSDSSREQV